jgi:hypothetical protein
VSAWACGEAVRWPSKSALAPWRRVCVAAAQKAGAEACNSGRHAGASAWGPGAVCQSQVLVLCIRTREQEQDGDRW